MKVDALMGSNWLQGTAGDSVHAILCAADRNLGPLLQVIATFFTPRSPGRS